MTEKWKLKRLKQCDKCPWKTSTDPHDIPDGYSEERHRNLKGTISTGLDSMFRGQQRIMACHESTAGNESHCIGWLMNQLGPGNNIGLRMQMISCENSSGIQLVGDQHECLEDTLP